MRYRWLWVSLGLVFLAGCLSQSSTLAEGPNSGNRSTVTGRYAYVGNPCTTEPCLPGMAYAVLAGDIYYYLTVNDQWLSASRSWNGYTPLVDDRVTVTGYIGRQNDVFGNLFYTIEVLSLQPAN